MAYNGSIDLISGIRQKNNGTFPLVDARDVYVTDGKRLNAVLDEKADAVDTVPAPETPGTEGQILQIDADGDPVWSDVGTPSDTQVGDAVNTWLAAHPEATTTVQDGAITRAKLDAALQAKTDPVPTLDNAMQAFGTGRIPLESGGWDSDGATKTDMYSRLRNVYPIPRDLISSVTLPDGYSASGYTLDKDLTKVSTLSYAQTHNLAAMASNVKFINLSIRKDDAESSDIRGYLDTVQAGTETVWNGESAMTGLAELGSAAFQFRGTFADLGYTATTQCANPGWYTFTNSDKPNITDLPAQWSAGGTVIRIKNGSSGGWLIIFDSTKRYKRAYGGSGWGEWNPDVMVDTTLSKAGYAADAKAAGDAIAALDSSLGAAAFQNRGKISDLGYTSIAQCNKMGFYEFVTADVANLADLPDGWSTGGYVVTLKKASGAMQYVFTNRIRYVRDGFTGTWYPDATVDTTLTKAGFAADAKAVGDRLAPLEAAQRKCYAIFNEAQYSRSDARLRIYLPQPVGYLMIDMRHYNYNVSSGDQNWGDTQCWGIDNAYSMADNRSTQRFIITQDGEWEMAVRMKDGKDFSGGGTHGDEKNAVTKLFLDGVETAFSALTTETEFDELKIIQTSEVYSPSEGFVGDPEGSPTASYKIADHGTEWIYNKDGIIINQYLKWAGAFNMANTFLAMFPVRKYTPVDSQTKLPVEGSFHVVDTLYTDTGYSLYDLDANGDGSSVQYPSAAMADIYSEESGLRCRINAMEYPRTLPGGNKISETDNRSAGSAETNYYKLYWPVTSSNAYTTTAYTTTENEIWKSKVKYELIVGDGTHFSE